MFWNIHFNLKFVKVKLLNILRYLRGQISFSIVDVNIISEIEA